MGNGNERGKVRGVRRCQSVASASEAGARIRTVVWGEAKWEQGEQVQREMGKMILGCSPKMTNEVVLGELGWWTLKGRRDFLTLNFWGKIVGMSPHRLVYHVYHTSRSRYDNTHDNTN